VLLNTFTPDLYVQYFRDLRDLAGAQGADADPGAGGDSGAGRPALTPGAIGEVMSRYATEVTDQYAGD